MAIYDIFQVEDENILRMDLKNKCEERGMSYYGVCSLRGLRDSLKKGIIGKINVVDMNFFYSKKDPGRYGPTAIKIIKDKYPKANIILYSSEQRLDETAKQLDVDFLNKREFFVKELVIELKRRIEEMDNV